MRVEIGICGGRWVKSRGDGLLATFDSPSRAIRCAWALKDRVRSDFGIEIRAGLHTGEIETRGDDVAGMTVHQAARIQGAAGNSEVFVSASVRNLVAGAGITLDDRGPHTLKGIFEPCELYRVCDIGDVVVRADVKACYFRRKWGLSRLLVKTAQTDAFSSSTLLSCSHGSSTSVRPKWP